MVINCFCFDDDSQFLLIHTNTNNAGLADCSTGILNGKVMSATRITRTKSRKRKDSFLMKKELEEQPFSP